MRTVGILFLLSVVLCNSLIGGADQTQTLKRQLDALKIAVAEGYKCLGNYYELKQDLLPALNAYLISLSAFRGLTVQRSEEGYVCYRVASIFSVVNKTGLAKRYLQKAMDAAVKYRDCRLKVMVFNTYSKLYQDAGDSQNALKFIQRSVKTSRTCSHTFDLKDTYYQEYWLLKQMGRQRDAARLLEAAVDEGLEKKDFENLLPMLVEFGLQLSENGDYKKVEKVLSTIDDLYAPYHSHYFFYYYLEAILARKRGDIESALDYFEKTHRSLSDYFSSFTSSGYYRYKEKIGEMYGHMIRFYVELYEVTGNFEYIRRALYFSEIKNNAHFEPMGDGPGASSYLNQQKESLSQEFSFYNKRYQECRRDREDGNLLEFYESKMAQLRNQYSEMAEMISSASLRYKFYSLDLFDIKQIQKKLQPGQLILKFCLLEEETILFWIDLHGEGFEILSKHSSWIIDQIGQLTAPLDDFAGGRVDYLRLHFDLNIAAELYKCLLRDLLSRRPDVEELLVIPGQEFYKLPFDALVLDVNPGEPSGDAIFSEYRAVDYLIQKYAVSYYISLFHLQKTFHCPPQKKYTVEIFADPVIQSNNKRESRLSSFVDLFFDPLPSAKAEALDVQKIVGSRQCRLFLGENFTISNFEAFAPEARVVHLATHFVNNEKYPNHSAFLFSDTNDHSPFFYAHDLFRSTLNAQLVVLSACETAEKSLRGLLGLRGMMAAFRRANTNSVMVSLWPVDEFSSRLLPEFYRHYLEGGNLSRCLQKAKLTLMNQEAFLPNGVSISFAHPFIWSDFILYHNFL